MKKKPTELTITTQGSPSTRRIPLTARGPASPTKNDLLMALSQDQSTSQGDDVARVQTPRAYTANLMGELSHGQLENYRTCVRMSKD